MTAPHTKFRYINDFTTVAVGYDIYPECETLTAVYSG